MTDGPDYEQREIQLREEGWARHQFAEAAELAAAIGGHRGAARGLERTLLLIAGLSELPTKSDAQLELGL